MLSQREISLLEHILNHIDRVIIKTQNLNKESFLDNEDIKEIVCLHILQIGELAKKFSDSFIERYNKVPWKKIKGMRDIIAHGYGTLDYNDVWKTAFFRIPELKEYIVSILDEFENIQ